MNSKASYSTRFPRGNRNLQEFFYTPCPQVAITFYPVIGTCRLPISLTFNEIYRLYSQLAGYNWQLIDGMPADSVKILATAERLIAGGVK